MNFEIALSMPAHNIFVYPKYTRAIVLTFFKIAYASVLFRQMNKNKVLEKECN